MENGSIKNEQHARVLSVLLLGAGVLALLAGLRLLDGIAGWLWGVLMVSAGMAGFAWARSDAQRWWAAIPAGALLGLGLAALGGVAWGGTLLFVGLGWGFVVVARSHPERWWALIPAGALLTLAIVTRAGAAGGTVLFLGLATTFAALPFTARFERHRWAWFPALGCLAVATMTLGWVGQTWNLIWALALIVGGAWVLTSSRRDRHHE
jgi:hypothetical protein